MRHAHHEEPEVIRDASNPAAGRINAADQILGPTLSAGRHDDAAILFGDATVSFGELEQRSNRVANALEGHAQPGERVLMLMKDSPDFVAAFLGIMRRGCVAVPLSTRLTSRDLAFALGDSEAVALLVDDEFVPLYRGAAEQAGTHPGLIAVRGQPAPGTVALDRLMAEAPATACSRPMDRDDMAFWLYSSGTTGTPKAVIHCHGDVSVGDEYMRCFGIRPGAKVFASSKLFFAFSLGHTLIGALRAGATIVLHDGWPDAAAIADVVDRHRPDVMLSVPTMFRNLLREGHAARDGFRNVRAYLSAGEALPIGLYRRWLEETGVPIAEGIGATETVFMFISGTPDAHCAGATGKPMPYAEVKLLDEHDRPVVAVDAPGVAWTRLPSLCRGYWRQPDKTRAAFRDGWFKTGDVFSVDAEGWWHHQGRGDDLLKISGQWVSPGEIEECVAAVAGVAEAAVVGSANEDGLVRMTLFLVADESVRPYQREQLETAVRDAMQAALSIYKCPRQIRFIDAIPRTATGKIQRYRLRQLSTA